MFCKNCGGKVDEDASFCIYCGTQLKENFQNVQNVQTTQTLQPVYQNPEHNQPKTFMGVLLALVLGLWGILVGLLLYPSNTFARKSFIKSWSVTIIISAVIETVLSLIVYFTYGGIAIESFLF